MIINNDALIELISIIAKTSWETDEFQYDKNKNKTSIIMRTSCFVVELADFLESLPNYHNEVKFNRESFISATSKLVKTKTDFNPLKSNIDVDN